MRFLLPALLLGLELAASLGSSAARLSPEAHLRRSYQAEQRYDYSGLQDVVLSAGGETVRVRVSIRHRRPNETSVELVRQEGSEANRKGWDKGMATHFVQRLGSRRLPAEDHLNLLLSNYHLRRDGTERVARRRAAVVSIHPRRSGNPSQTLWIDAETGIVLRSQLRNCHGHLLSDIAFIQFDLGPRQGGSAPSRGGKRPSHPLPGFALLRPLYAPDGYQYIGAEGMRAGKEPVAHLRYSDGLNTISIFERMLKEPPRGDDRRPPKPQARSGGEARRRWDPKQAPFQLVRRRLGNIMVTLIGDVPRPELERMADSLR